ncbi:hypothetical protein QUF99_02995 [Bacillus sp. DX4.1]|uniref:DUF6985 domain-containing protein n=1 Tax=Bacillus sp. DX4.1 TaxID=3055867 RepID=UPI0025A04F88|nr:hypothetical protein [Bacillus sp. DX4.1]MDM5186410.1 hypothetical protein [Bacillus sp. DX4.1]
MKKLNDDLFGEISFDLYWSGQINIVMFGAEREIILSIDGKEDGHFSPIQKQAFIHIKFSLIENWYNPL